MSEQEDVWYIPGDSVTVEMGHFTHRQHLAGVSMTYELGSDTSQRIVLRGEPESVNVGSAGKPGVYYSKATASAVISASLPPGAYWLRRITAHTYGEQEREIEGLTAEHLSSWGVPRTIYVDSEPFENPKFV